MELGIAETIERRPYEEEAALGLLSEWCKAHSDIRLLTLERKEWERLDKIMIENNGEKELALPDDLQLWELAQVAEIIDFDAGGRLKMGGKSSKKGMAELGCKFEKAAVYMANRIDKITVGSVLAKETIENFYRYGNSLQDGKKTRGKIDTAKIARNRLTAEETEEMDKWLAGEEYGWLKKKTEKGVVEEHLRGEMLARFFRVSHNLLLRKTETKKRDFLERIKQGLKYEIDAPEREIERVVFELGKDKLVLGMMSRLSQFIGERKHTVYEWLDVPSLRKELERVRKTGRVEKIGRKEVEIAEKIQNELMKLRYKDDAFRPTDIINDQELNCIGFTLLGAVLFEEVGLRYLTATVPEHSTMMLVTTNDRLIYMDMQSSMDNRQILDDDLEEKTASVEEIARQVWEGTFKIGWFKFRTAESMSFAMGDREVYAQIFLSIGVETKDEEIEMKIKALKKVIEIDKYISYPYVILGDTIDDEVEKEKLYIKAMRLGDIDAFVKIGDLYDEQSRVEEAIKVYRKAIELGSNDAIFNLAVLFDNRDRMEEAIETYKEYVAREIRESEKEWVESAKERISELVNNPV